MKKTLIILTISLLILSGCQLFDDVQNSYNNVVTEAALVKDKAIETKASIEEKVQKVQDAADAVQEAADALGEL